jgi:endonuclease YncB( thermonuclease family)
MRESAPKAEVALESAADKAPSPEPKPKGDCCTAVIDGGTIDVRKADGSSVVVRLLGVSPMGKAAELTVEGSHSRLSRTFVEKFVLGKNVRIELEPPTVSDLDGNVVAYVYRVIDGELLNENVIAGGFAVVSSTYPFKREERFRSALKAARSEFRGVWGFIKQAEDTRKRWLVEDDKIASKWLKMAANLEGSNPAAARTWYQKVLDNYPDAPSADKARERLKLKNGATSSRK